MPIRRRNGVTLHAPAEPPALAGCPSEPGEERAEEAQTSSWVSQSGHGPVPSQTHPTGTRRVPAELPARLAVRAWQPIALITFLCFLPALSTESLFAIHLPRDFIGI